MDKKIFTIFGGTGDLTYRKLLPALFNIYSFQQLTDFEIVIIGRRPYNNQEYVDITTSWVKEFSRVDFDELVFEDFTSHIHYFQMDFTKLDAYDDLARFYQEKRFSEHIFYFAVAPRFFKNIADGLKTIKGLKKASIVIEKPFGEDLKSAKELNKELEASFGKENIYHIDHYLGKEMVRNIMTIRFANPMFSAIWNKDYIDNIQISALEMVGVESRAAYYDHSGALRDMVQNHLLQILSIVAMEPLGPNSKLSENQLEVLKQLRIIKENEIASQLVLGQYEDYLKEDNVAVDSKTETYAALKLFIDNKRWENVPFYIRTGKKLNRREMEVVVTFKKANPDAEANVLIIKIQPNEGVYFKFNIKKPGNSDEIIATQMDFCQSCDKTFRINTPEAYERLLLAVANSDSSMFSDWDVIETSWKFIDDLVAKANKKQFELKQYRKGSNGPIESTLMLQNDGFSWFEGFQKCRKCECE